MARKPAMPGVPSYSRRPTRKPKRPNLAIRLIEALGILVVGLFSTIALVLIYLLFTICSVGVPVVIIILIPKAFGNLAAL